MSRSAKPAEIWYSPKLMEPFEGLLPIPPRRAPQSDAPPGERPERPWVPIASAHDALQDAAARRNDATLGLRAGLRMELGEAGILEYAMHTAATLRAALLVGARYIRLLNHALEIRLEPHAEGTLVCLHSRVALPAVAEDFMLCAFYRAHLQRPPRQPARTECWISHAEPSDWATREAYARAFEPASLRFSAPSSGFLLPSSDLDAPQARADARLHAILLEAMDRALQEQPLAPTFTDRVRARLVQRLSAPRLSSALIARDLKLSERTLARRLAGEGTSYGALLEDVRRVQALKALDDSQVNIDQLAFQLGFSQATAFYRAFKRWTGQTPRQYRQYRQARRLRTR